MRKVGLFFGSFNPVHIGHLIIASHVADHTELKEIWFVVSPHNPHKKKKSLLEGHHRLEMVRRAVEHDLRFRVSDVEFGLAQPSYTTITLAHLKEKHPNVSFSLLMGGDNLATLHKWKNHEAILENHPIIIYSRPNAPTKNLSLPGNLTLIDAPQMHISSSHIRNEVESGHDTQYLMPKAAWEYMMDMNFYR